MTNVIGKPPKNNIIMINKMKKLILPIIALLLSTQLRAQSEFKTKSISIFKNGQAFVITEGAVSTTNNVYTLTKVPNALFGTLWLTGLQSDIVQVTSKQEGVEESVECKAVSFRDLLFANKGKQFTLTTNDEKIYTGIIEDFDLQNDINSPLLIQTNNTWIGILPSSIKNIEFAEKPEKIAISTTKTVKPVVKVQFAKGGNQSLNMMYLQNGISWVPTYLLEIQSDTEARLKLQAEVVNNAEDIEKADVNFVVGVPNFKYANNPAILIPPIVKQIVEKTRSNTDNFNYGNMFSNAIHSSYDFNSDNSDLDNVNTVVVSGIQSDASEDFYFYNIKDISLEKGGRAHFPLFTVPVKIKHLYEANLSTRGEQGYRRYTNNPNFLFGIEYCNVSHSIEIKNNSKNPFTTGSVMVIDGKTQRPLIEDLIKYTAIGQSSYIKLAESPDIRVEEQEKIIDSKLENKKWGNYTYKYLLTVQSEVVIVNSKKQDIEMVVHKNITGKCKTATINYTNKQEYSNDINPREQLKFTLNIKAGQIFKFTYTYEIYVYE